eukprot:8588029-Pyramimonas_sp.AAC.1
MVLDHPSSLPSLDTLPNELKNGPRRKTLHTKQVPKITDEHRARTRIPANPCQGENKAQLLVPLSWARMLWMHGSPEPSPTPSGASQGSSSGPIRTKRMP